MIFLVIFSSFGLPFSIEFEFYWLQCFWKAASRSLSVSNCRTQVATVMIFLHASTHRTETRPYDFSCQSQINKIRIPTLSTKKKKDNKNILVLFVRILENN